MDINRYYRKLKKHKSLMLLLIFSIFSNINCELCTSTQNTTSAKGTVLFFRETNNNDADIRHVEPIDKTDEKSDLLVALFSPDTNEVEIFRTDHSGKIASRT